MTRFTEKWADVQEWLKEKFEGVSAETKAAHFDQIVENLDASFLEQHYSDELTEDGFYKSGKDLAEDLVERWLDEGENFDELEMTGSVSEHPECYEVGLSIKVNKNTLVEEAFKDFEPFDSVVSNEHRRRAYTTQLITAAEALAGLVVQQAEDLIGRGLIERQDVSRVTSNANLVLHAVRTLRSID